MEHKQDLEGWAICEIMGHVTIAGYVQVVAMGGAALLRVDVPGNEHQAEFTKLFGASAIYAITPTDEETARHAAGRLAVRPVSLWTVPDPKPRLVDSRADYASADDVDPEDEESSYGDVYEHPEEFPF